MRAARLASDSLERRHARSVFALPIFFDSSVNGWSISNCTSAVVAIVEPSSGPRRSTMTTVAGGGQRLCHHGAADAHADGRHVRLDVAREPAHRNFRGAVGAPDGAAGPEIELARHVFPGRKEIPCSTPRNKSGSADIVVLFGVAGGCGRPPPPRPYGEKGSHIHPISSRRTSASITAMPSALSFRQGMWLKFLPPP